MKGVLAAIHKYLSLLIGLAIFVQFLLAGIWHAGVVPTPDAHVTLGLTLVVASLLALLAAIGGRLPGRVIGVTAVLFLLILLQPILIEQRRAGMPLISALHPLNAAFIGVVSGVLGRMSQSAAAAEEASVMQPATGD